MVNFPPIFNSSSKPASTVDEAFQVEWHGQTLSIRDIDGAIGYILSMQAKPKSLTSKKAAAF